MATRTLRLIRRCALSGALAALAFAPATASAQSSDSATVRLIQILIAKGILTKGQAASLLTEAQSEASASPARHVRRASAPHVVAERAQMQAPSVPAAPKGEVRVTYVPQFVRDQIAAEVRQQMMRQVEAEGWAKPDALPEWTKRIVLYGDLRMRYQGDYENKGNIDSSTGLPYLFPDFNTINAGAGYDTSGAALPPLLNVSENRTRLRVRARIGVRAQIDNWISSDVRIATGNDDSPVSENQTQGQPGDFSKYAIWIDRAYLTLTPLHSLKLLVGRTPNPYFVTDLMYAPDLNFDGAAVQYVQPIAKGLNLFAIGGAHPVFNEALNFSSTEPVKGSSRDAYLLAAQLGADWRISHDYGVKIAAGYFAYSNISGKESALCLLLTSADTCSSDDSRPPFLQFGNTLIPIRNIVTNASSLAATPQYYGLASRFGVVDLHGRFNMYNFDPVIISLEGEFLKNLAFNRSYILSRTPANNIGSNNAYQGGDTGYTMKITVGAPQVVEAWDWNVSLAYKYLETDAAVDAFTDPDFHLGGTNAKGYVVGGNLGIAHDTYLSARWLSATQISGPPYGNNVLQLDLNTKF
jgi:hypothetical protein